MRRYQKDWNELALREPYYSVITDPRFLTRNLNDETILQFFEGGEADVQALLSEITACTGEDFRPRTALDFGCGVGRLTLALARRAEHVTGCDISPAMLAIARKNAIDACVKNVEFVSTLDQVVDKKFDFICSLLVFQHIPAGEGLDALSALLKLLAPEGVLAAHFTLRRPGTRLRRVARRLRASLPIVHAIATRLHGDALRLPYMQMNAYSEAEIQRRVREVTGREAVVIPRTSGEIESALFVARHARV
ncbi:MAG: class I SAM-dependent methyltransferase [Thermoanaerobaculia bacterium]